MSLHTVRTADDQHRIIQHLQGPLHLCRKIHMSGRIQKRHVKIAQLQLCLLGKYRNAASPLHRIRIQKGILMVHSAQPPQCTGPI